MSDPARAVFVSYASEDSPAASKICDALRAAGVEVWFDKNDLRGGDAWDTKIRQQVRECALFIPVISANTQARTEGYFRREWNLAAARILDMAKGKPFLLPVAIDSTKDGEALVPDEFLHVQWTRVANERTLPALVQRVCRLLGQETVAAPEWPAAPAVSTGTRPQFSDKSLAVLAFANLSDDKENEHFSDGISEELINVLAKVPGLRVSARTSAFSFKGRQVPISEFASQLGVAYVVEGSVRRVGNRVRIAAQLINAADGCHLWSDKYDRGVEDIFAVQDEIAAVIMKELRAAIMGSQGDGTAGGLGTEAQTAARGRTQNVEAYGLFFKGRQHLARLSREDFKLGIGCLQHAITLDPTFALAWAELARAYQMMSQYGYQSYSLGFTLSRAVAQRALALEPQLAEAHAALGQVYLKFDWDWPAAAEANRHALALSGGDYTIVTGAVWQALTLGQIDEAIRLGRRAVELDPLNSEAHFVLGYAYFFGDRLDEAEKEMRRMIKVSPAAAWGHCFLSIFYLLQGRVDDAVTALAQENVEMSGLTGQAFVRFAEGQREESDEALRQLAGKYAAMLSYQIAEIHAYRGEPDEAFEWLERAQVQRDPGMSRIRQNPLLRNLHADPRWSALLKKMNLLDFPR